MSEAAVPFSETKAPESAERLNRGALRLVDISASTMANIGPAYSFYFGAGFLFLKLVRPDVDHPSHPWTAAVGAPSMRSCWIGSPRSSTIDTATRRPRRSASATALSLRSSAQSRSA